MAEKTSETARELVKRAAASRDPERWMIAYAAARDEGYDHAEAMDIATTVINEQQK